MTSKKTYTLREKRVSNKIKTPGYTIKRLKDNGFVVLKIWNAYSNSDPRRWTILIDPAETSVFLTCYQNKDELNEVLFEFDDGGNNFTKGFFIKTDSVEVIINYLIEKGVNNNPAKSPFLNNK